MVRPFEEAEQGLAEHLEPLQHSLLLMCVSGSAPAPRLRRTSACRSPYGRFTRNRYWNTPYTAPVVSTDVRAAKRIFGHCSPTLFFLSHSKTQDEAEHEDQGRGDEVQESQEHQAVQHADADRHQDPQGRLGAKRVPDRLPARGRAGTPSSAIDRTSMTTDSAITSIPMIPGTIPGAS